MKITIWDVLVVVQYSPTGNKYEHEENVVAPTRRDAIRALIHYDDINPRQIYRTSAIERDSVIFGGVK
jgi:hypothetical protein